MTNNELQYLLDALELPAQARVAARDLEVDDWVLLSGSSSRSADWQQVISKSPRDSRRTEMRVRCRNGAIAIWVPNNAETVTRSLTALDQPPLTGPLARRHLSTEWPDTPFRVHTTIGGVTVRWTDGPSYDDVHGLLTAAGVERIGMERTRTPRLLAAAVLRAESANPHACDSSLAAAARVLSHRPDTMFTVDEWTVGQVLQAASPSAEVFALVATLRRLGRSTLQAILTTPRSES
jgi:hypothetical protein